MPGSRHDNDEAGRGRAVVRDAERNAEYGDPAGRGIVAELQQALLPTALPVLPRVRIAARYLVAGQEQAAGGDWFDAIPLDSGAVALVVGDVVGNGVAASAASSSASTARSCPIAVSYTHLTLPTICSV